MMNNGGKKRKDVSEMLRRDRGQNIQNVRRSTKDGTGYKLPDRKTLHAASLSTCWVQKISASGFLSLQEFRRIKLWYEHRLDR
jgi:hypothetical protein